MSVLILLACTLLGEARAEVKILTERNDNDHATPVFKFRTVPNVNKDDAGTRAIFSVLDGERDPSSGDLDKLSDGTLPKRVWDMGAHFFFRTGSPGGAILMDLGDLTDLKQVNTYSWHSSTRGPQLYQLYAHDGSGDGFNARPAKAASLEKAGWKLITKVDTRTDDKPGGQYGVSISDSTGSLGKFRYLIFKMERTENTDSYGNTFYSEIDVIGRVDPAAIAKAAETPKVPAVASTSTPAKAPAPTKASTASTSPTATKAPETTVKPVDYRLRSAN
jgi:hypothetical protein